MQVIRKLFVVFALVAIVSSLSVIFAQTKKGAGQKDGMPPPPMQRGGFNPRMFEELNLSDEQKTQIKTLMDNARTASEQYHEKIRSSHDQMKSIIEASAFNEEQARQILNAKAQAETEIEIIHLRTESAIYKLLTVEQKTQLEQLKQKRPEFPRGGEFRQGPPPPKNK